MSEALIRSYRAHIDEEERTVFPAARELLAPSDLDAMQQEIDVRRGRARG